MSGGVNELPVMIPGICCWWQSTDRTKDPPHVLHRKFSSKRVPRIGWFSPNIAHAHPPVCSRLPPLVPHKSPQKQQMQVCVETQRNANKALPTNCAGPRRMLPPPSAGPSRSWSQACSSVFPLTPHPTPTPRSRRRHPLPRRAEGLCCTSHCCWPFFPSHPHLSWGGGAESARIDLNREATRWGGKERKQERCVEFDAFMAGGAAVSVRMGKREDGRMNENPICKI